ncbi:DNA-binding Xre family transcriptional regulator [Paenibacillus sp. DS2015]|uniref:helix-turn-helix domain-containing protein n=1 Tax=Paenibacillus sp. DS2015 TaxID=3373917 RepID=UPI003D225BAC
MNIRSNLRELTDDRGITIRELSRDIDYRFESVRIMYNDEMERYPRDLLSKLCVYFNVTAAELLTLSND